MTGQPTRDEVDTIVEAWRRERPDLDVAPMEVLSRISRLARHLDRLLRETLVTSGTMTNRVDRLAARGLAARQDHPEDRRGVLVQLTQAGKDAVDAAMAELLTAERGILAGLNVSEHDQLTRSLRLLLARYGADASRRVS